MKTMNARVHLIGEKKEVAHHNNVKVDTAHGWIALEDQYGEVTIYPAHCVLRVEAKPTYYDRDN